MSIRSTPSINQSKESIFHAELAALALPDRIRRIDEQLQQTSVALASRNEKLLALRGDFDRLTLDFWRGFARSLGCEDPGRAIAAQKERMRSVAYLSTIGLILGLSVFFGNFYLSHGDTFVAIAIGVSTAIWIGAMIVSPLAQIDRARQAAVILGQEQEPFWLTGGSIALSNLGITPPAEAKWWWPDRIALVFVQHLAVRFSIDALTGELIWENLLCTSSLSPGHAAQILRDLLATNPRYRQMVSTFQGLAGLENEHAFLAGLKAETEQALQTELRMAEERATQLRKAQREVADASQARPEPRQGSRAQSGPANAQKASWETLIIPKSLRENLQAYCRILKQAEAYQAAGVQLPKGLLFYGPPGCGKTQIAKTLSAEGGLNFVSLSTSDVKQMWIGWSADRLAKVFAEARAKQPSLIFIDEIDAVCPPRGMYNDAISQEATAQLLQEIDGINSDGQAVFICAATNRVDHVDSAMLSRFAERIEIPLPDEPTRGALLKVFLGTMRFVGNRQQAIEALAKSSAGRSGRNLRNLLNAAVLAAVKRTAGPKDFALTAGDFDQKTASAEPATVLAPSAPASFHQLDPAVRTDAVAALVALGFRQKQAVARVDAVTAGSTVEQVIKSALQGGRA